MSTISALLGEEASVVLRKRPSAELVVDDGSVLEGASPSADGIEPRAANPQWPGISTREPETQPQRHQNFDKTSLPRAQHF
jgi:hypothetical protein